MLSEKNRRTLICYAGSASEASIGSKPIGSELVMFICILIAKSQHLIDLTRNWRSLTAPLKRTQYIETYEQSKFGESSRFRFGDSK